MALRRPAPKNAALRPGRVSPPALSTHCLHAKQRKQGQCALSRSNGRRKEKDKGLISLQVAPRRLYRPAGSERGLLIGGVD